jgi:hypothetical protein
MRLCLVLALLLVATLSIVSFKCVDSDGCGCFNWRLVSPFPMGFLSIAFSLLVKGRDDLKSDTGLLMDLVPSFLAFDTGSSKRSDVVIQTIVGAHGMMNI